MFNSFTFKTALAAAMVAGALSASAQDEWAVTGTFNEWGQTQLAELDGGIYTLFVNRLDGNFNFQKLGDEPVVLGAAANPFALGEYNALEEGGENIVFAEGISYVSDAYIELNPAARTVLIAGTAVADGKEIEVVYVSGSFNNWDVTEGSAMLNREPGTQIYSGRVDLAGDTDVASWLLYTELGDPDKAVWGLEAASESENQLEGTLVADSKNAVRTAAGQYDFWFNMATGMFRLTEVKNAADKEIIASPAAGSENNIYNTITLVFEGYNTAELDPSMYDIFNAPGTFTCEATGEVVARVGGQPLPFPGNMVVLQLSQTIFNNEYLVQGNPEDEGYVPYENGNYILDLPAGVINLNDGVMTVPNEPISLLFKLANMSADGIADVEADLTGADVYNLSGVCVLRAADADSINSLPAGIYVVKGRKIAVK